MLSHIHRMHIVQARDLFDADYAFMTGFVRQPRWADKVANGIDIRLTRSAVFIDHYMSAIDFHASAVQSYALDVANDTDRRNHPIHSNVLALTTGLDCHRHLVIAFLGALYCRIDKIFIPCFSNALCAKAEISSSSTGRILGRTSTTVTCAPIFR